MILQEDTLEGYKFEANSFPTKELAFKLTSYNARAMRMKREYWP